MAEKIVEGRLFELRYYCDAVPATVAEKKCDGMMVPTGQMMPVAGQRVPLHKHICNKCRDVKYLHGTYPMPLFLPVGDPIPDEWVEKLDRDRVNNPPEVKPKIALS